MDSLHVRYRPRTFEQVIGQSATVNSLQNVLKKVATRAFLFVGPSGCGKTTCARIAARFVGCRDKDILEFDGATYTGIDSMRQVTETLHYRPFGGAQSKVVIIDECHAISRQSWQSLLKVVEEPPPHVYWFFCTTEPGKVPDTIKTRCARYEFKLVRDDELLKLLRTVAKKERIKLSDGIIDLIVREARGSPRQLLVNLTMCAGVKDRKEAVAILQAAVESDAVLELCRFLLKGGSWMRAMSIVSKLDDHNPESVRIVVCNYMSSVLRGMKSDKQVVKVLPILEAFSVPFNQSDRTAPLVLAIGRVLFGE